MIDNNPSHAGIKILHASMLGMPLSQSPGFKAQLEGEWRAAHSLRGRSEVDWDTVLLIPEHQRSEVGDFDVPILSIPERFRSRLARRYYLWSFIRRAASRYDAVLVRHSVVDPFEVLGTRLLRNVAIVHHSKSVEELHSVGHPVLARVEAWLLERSRKHAWWPVGVTGELHAYTRGHACKTKAELVLPNGIDLDAHLLLPSEESHPDHIQLLFVASEFAPWHGLDRLLSKIKAWTAAHHMRLTLHLVGHLTDEQHQEVVGTRRVGVQIETYGQIPRPEVIRLAAKADLGIASLALDRKGMTDACTLKVRDYLASGLPVFSTHRDSGLPTDFPYYRILDSVDLDQLVSFALEVRDVDRRTIRKAAAPYISKEEIMLRVARGMLREIKETTAGISR